MYRWGNRNNHSYIVYAGNSKSRAIDAGEEERDYRGAKYAPEVTEHVPDYYDQDLNRPKIVYGEIDSVVR
jgi:hypothetical protein